MGVVVERPLFRQSQWIGAHVGDGFERVDDDVPQWYGAYQCDGDHHDGCDGGGYAFAGGEVHAFGFGRVLGCGAHHWNLLEIRLETLICRNTTMPVAMKKSTARADPMPYWDWPMPCWMMDWVTV